jgi:hypothetical protein
MDPEEIVCYQVTVKINTFQQQQATIEEFLEAVFFMWSTQRLYDEDTSPVSRSWVGSWQLRQLPTNKDMNVVAEEYTLLGAII